jgi:hypothetical protein
MAIAQAPRGTIGLPIKPIRGYRPKINSGDLLTTPAKELKRLGNPLAQSSWLGAGHNRRSAARPIRSDCRATALATC